MDLIYRYGNVHGQPKHNYDTEKITYYGSKPGYLENNALEKKTCWQDFGIWDSFSLEGQLPIA